MGACAGALGCGELREDGVGAAAGGSVVGVGAGDGAEGWGGRGGSWDAVTAAVAADSV